MPPRSRPLLASVFALSLSLPSLARADLDPAREALNRGDYSAAEPQLRAATGRDRAEADRLLGRLLLETGRYADAQSLGSRLSRVAATRVEGLTLEGEALAAQGQHTEALARWNQAVQRGNTAAGRRARALAGVWLATLGRPDEARELTLPLVDEYNDAQQEAEEHPDTPGHLNPRTAVLRDAEALTYLGMALRVLGHFQDANQALNDAVRIDPRRVETQVEHAVLFLSKEDMGHAGEALRAALEVNAHSPVALVMRARTRLANSLDFVHAREDLEAAERVNPNMPEVFALRAQMLLRDDDIAGADRLLDRALQLNPRHLEALATRAVVRFHAGDNAGMRRALDAVFAVAPTYVEAYDLLADFADWGHRYQEAIDLMREGLQRQAISTDRRLQGRMRATLGINLLRTGDEEHALPELQESFNRDRYNVRVFNLLNLYEDTLSHHYTIVEGQPFRLRYHNDERAVLSRYAPQLLQRAYDDMVRRYHFTPQGPVTVELFNDTEHFSVRTSGLPEIGVQGVCFGRVITAISPGAQPFNWGQVLWHELGHVFAIQLSRSRVPRWFTEGLSEWEAFHSHPEWAREDDPQLFAALAANRIPNVADFNTAFTHARSGGDMLTAYYAASKLVEFMIDRFTFERVAALLPLWAQNLSTAEVLQRGLGVSAAELDRQFREFTRNRLQRYTNQWNLSPSDFAERERLDREAAAAPTNAEAQGRAAVANLLDGHADIARDKAREALRLDPQNALGHYVLARVGLAANDGREALTHVDALLAGRRDGFALRLLEARAARAAHDDARLRTALEAATRLDPSQSEPWELLAAMHRRANRPAEQLRALREVVRLDQHNRDALHTLLELLEAQSQWADLRALTEHARNLDPFTLQTHATLARAALESRAWDDAIYEYDTALLLNPRNQREALRVGLARALLGANQRTRAQLVVREGLRDAPSNAELQALQAQLGAR